MSQKKNIFRYLSLIALLVALGSATVFYVSKSNEILITNKDLGTRLVSYSEQTFDQEGGALLSIDCAPDVGCVKGTRSTVDESSSAASGWLMALYSRAYLSTGDEKYKSKIKQQFEKFYPTISSPMSFHLWPLYEAYKATGDPIYLWHFVSNVAQQAYYFSNSTYIETNLTKDYPMVTSNYSTQLLQLRELLLKDSEHFKDFGVNKDYYDWLKQFFVNSKEWDLKLLNLSSQLLSAGEIANQKIKGSYNELFFEDTFHFPSQSCWQYLGHAKRYNFTQDERSLDFLKDFISSSQLTSRSIEDFRPVSLQTVLPCLELLKFTHSVLRENANAFQNLTNELLQTVLDSKERPICDGDNSVLSMIRTGTEKEDILYDCSQGHNNKSLPDMAYLYMILDGHNSQYSIRKSFF